MCSVLGWKTGEWFLWNRWADKNRNKCPNKWYGWEYSVYEWNKQTHAITETTKTENWNCRKPLFDTNVSSSGSEKGATTITIEYRELADTTLTQKTCHMHYQKDRCSESHQLDELKICIMERCFSSLNGYIFLMNLFSDFSDSWPL